MTTMPHGRLAFFLPTALLMAACDPGWELNISVDVPSEVQAEASDDFPVQIVVAAETLTEDDDPAIQGDLLPYRLAVLCEPSADDVSLRDEYLALGCSTETVVSAWMAPLALEEGQSCEPYDPGDATQPAGLPEPPTAPLPDEPQAEAFAFAGHESNCSSSADDVELRLAAP